MPSSSGRNLDRYLARKANAEGGQMPDTISTGSRSPTLIVDELLAKAEHHAAWAEEHRSTGYETLFQASRTKALAYAAAAHALLTCPDLFWNSHETQADLEVRLRRTNRTLA